MLNVPASFDISTCGTDGRAGKISNAAY